MDNPWGELPDWFGEKNNHDEDELLPDDDDPTAASGLHGAQHCIILIDTGPSMTTPSIPDPDYPDDLTSPLDVALDICNDVLRRKVRNVVVEKTGKRDAVGIYLYNTRVRLHHEHDKTKDAVADGDEVVDDEDDDDRYSYMNRPQGSSCHCLIPLEPPGAHTILTLRKCMEVMLVREVDLAELYGYEQEDLAVKKKVDVMEEDDKDDDAYDHGQSPLRIALEKSLQVFAKDNPKIRFTPKAGQPRDHCQVWILTNDARPTQDSPAALELLRTTRQDFREYRVRLTVGAMPCGDNDAPPVSGAFYQDQLGIDVVAYQDRDVLVDELQLVWKKARRAMTVPLILPDWRSDGVNDIRQDQDDNIVAPSYKIPLDWYRLVQLRTLPSQVTVDNKTGRPLAQMKQLVRDGEILYERIAGTSSSAGGASHRSKGVTEAGQGILTTYVEFAGSKVPMSSEDIAIMKRNSVATPDFASCLLLGFKSLDDISILHSHQTAYFVYPGASDDAVQAFSFLHKSMQQQGVCAICELLTYVSKASRLVAMWPIAAEVQHTEEGNVIVEDQVRPPGMLAIQLPFENEYREMPSDAGQTTSQNTDGDLASPELVSAAVELVDKMTLQDLKIGRDFPNAKLTTYWNYIESVALAESLKPPADDETIVQEENVMQKAGAAVRAFLEALPPDMKPEISTPKRKVLEADTSGVDWVAKYNDDTWGSCTVKQMQQKLKALGEKSSGKKADLMDRLEPYLEKEAKHDNLLEEEVPTEAKKVKTEHDE